MKGGKKLSIPRRLYKFVKYRILKLLFFRKSQPTLHKIRGRYMAVLPEVFHPGLYTTSPHLADMINSLGIRENDRVLDLGTGSGIGAVFSAQFTKHVVAVDINPNAVRCAKINALINGYEERISVRLGNLFEPVRDEVFDLIFFNPPFYLGKPKNWHETAFKGGDYPDHICHTFLRDAPKHLASDGKIHILWSSIADYPGLDEEIKENGLETAKITLKDTITEVIQIYELRHQKKQK